MTDILKFIHDSTALTADPDGNLLSLGEWSEASAADMAASEGITLTDAHYEVLHFLREHYRNHGDKTNATRLTRALEKAFLTQGGKRHLYQLFPTGPLTTASRLAGLPAPENSREPSFGVLH